MWPDRSRMKVASSAFKAVGRPQEGAWGGEVSCTGLENMKFRIRPS
jgi:hypothetical protein